MNIVTDTEEELDETIAAHTAMGWRVVSRSRRGDGAYAATLEPARKGDWITTFTGKKFWPLDPCADEICIEDIAHHLAMTCRYGGAVKEFYSVAEHCVLLSHFVAPENALWALLHDASEAYLGGDLQRPIKTELVGFREIESNIMQVVAEKFDLIGGVPNEIKVADKRIVADEARAICVDHSWTDGIAPLGVDIDCWDWQTAEKQFLIRFNELMKS